MAFKKVYDVFIAYHGSYEQNGSRMYADKVYEFLKSKNLKCFYFPATQNDAYKANIIDVMRSRTFLLVCTNGMHILKDKQIDAKYHYELSTEIDAFYALTQIGEASLKDAKVLACGEYMNGDEAEIHELFAKRTHLYYKDENQPLDFVYDWVMDRIQRLKTWNDTQITSEIKEVFATRASMGQSCHFDNLIAAAKTVKAVGISNSELTARINPSAVKNCIEHGGSIEILFLDPEGEYTKLREAEENLRRNRIKSITNVNIETALDIRDRIEKNTENFKLYIYDKQPRMNMIFVDDYLILQYYANNIPGIDNPSFFIERQNESPIFEFAQKVYQYLKAEAVEIEV